MSTPQQQYAPPGQAVPAPPPRPPEFTITPEPGDPLDDLLSRLADADARLADAERYRNSIDAAIKRMVTGKIPRNQAGQLLYPVVVIAAGPHRPAKRLGWGARRTFDKDRFEAENPGVYGRYLKWGKGFWGWRKAT